MHFHRKVIRYKGNQAQAEGILGMLATIQNDFEKTIKDKFATDDGKEISFADCARCGEPRFIEWCSGDTVGSQLTRLALNSPKRILKDDLDSHLTRREAAKFLWALFSFNSPRGGEKFTFTGDVLI